MQFLLETTKMVEQNNDGVKFAPFDRETYEQLKGGEQE